MAAHSIAQALRAMEPSFSFEFFPPKDDAAEEVLWHAVRRLEALSPAFVSVTYGAGGSTRDRTVRVTERIARETTLRPMAHLTCVSSSVDELREVIGQYVDGGVRDVLALRGDPPGGLGSPWTAHPDGLDHAEDLVRLVRSLGALSVGVAAFPDKHPEAASFEADADALVRKVDAGAEFAITQFVFDVASYARLRDLVAARGRDVPIVPGLMPVTSFRQVARMAQLSGTPLPTPVVARLEPLEGDPKALRDEGVAIATELGERLLAEGAPGLHFYTMNRSLSTVRVYRNLVGGAGEADAAGEKGEAPGASSPGLLRGGPIAAVRRFLDAVREGSWTRVAAALTDDVVLDLPVSGRRRRGRAEVMEWLRKAPPAVRVERMVHDGGRQVVVWLSSDEEAAGRAPGDGTTVHDVAFVTLDAQGRIAAAVALRAGA